MTTGIARAVADVADRHGPRERGHRGFAGPRLQSYHQRRGSLTGGARTTPTAPPALPMASRLASSGEAEGKGRDGKPFAVQGRLSRDRPPKEARPDLGRGLGRRRRDYRDLAAGADRVGHSPHAPPRRVRRSFGKSSRGHAEGWRAACLAGSPRFPRRWHQASAIATSFAGCSRRDPASPSI